MRGMREESLLERERRERVGEKEEGLVRETSVRGGGGLGGG